MIESVIEIAQGKLRGTFEQDIYSFKGIPYGGPTGGKNRFHPPVPAEPWRGIRDATCFGQACWQPLDVSPGTFDLFGVAGTSQMGEDCLVLNIWTPGLNDNDKRPVMVWLHGGGFFSGSGDHLPFYNGASLARTGNVVVVSINHRLGVFGFLNLEGLLGDEYAGSGNAGMLDIVQALQWVKDNIAVFGGNPANVTIFGESGGGAKVTTLLAMPAAKGLVHRAISESGPGLKERDAEDATRVARDYLNAFNLQPSQVGRLHEMRTDMIFAGWASLRPTIGMPMGHFAPVVEGKVLPAHPFDPVAAPSAAGVPLMIGTNKDEMTFMMMKQPQLRTCSENILHDELIQRFSDKAGVWVASDKIDTLIATYHRTRPEATPYDILVAISSDRMRIGAVRVAERKTAASPAPVYMYLFTWESPFDGGVLRSCHTVEMPFVFNNVDPPCGLIGNGPDRFALAKKVSSAWVAFARNGNPGHPGLPLWPAYTTEKRATMIFDVECKTVEDPRAEERKAWTGIC
jgi:para-nitrobenzyl esterase